MESDRSAVVRDAINGCEASPSFSAFLDEQHYGHFTEKQNTAIYGRGTLFAPDRGVVNAQCRYRSRGPYEKPGPFPRPWDKTTSLGYRCYSLFYSRTLPRLMGFSFPVNL